MPLLSVVRDDDEQHERRDRVPEWAKLLAPMILAAIVAYFTSEIRSQAAMSRMEEREGNHYLELKALLELQRQDTREAQRELKVSMDMLRQEVRTVLQEGGR